MTDEAKSPLRRRMIEDMTIRKFAPKTQHDYVQRVKNFAAFLGRSPDTATFEDVRRYQLHLAASGVGVPTINQTVSTLRFFFRVTLKRHDIVEHTHVIHERRKLPVVLSPEEVARLLDAAPGLKYKAALSRHRQALSACPFRANNGSRGFTSPNRKPPKAASYFNLMIVIRQRSTLTLTSGLALCPIGGCLRRRRSCLPGASGRLCVKTKSKEPLPLWPPPLMHRPGFPPKNKPWHSLQKRQSRWVNGASGMSCGRLKLNPCACYARSLGGSEMHDAASNAPLEPVAVGV